MKQNLSTTALLIVLLLFNMGFSQKPTIVGLSKNNLSIFIYEHPVNYDVTDLGNTKDFFLIQTEDPKVFKLKCLACNPKDHSNLLVYLENGDTYEYALKIKQNFARRIFRETNPTRISSKKLTVNESDSLNVIESKYSFYSNNVDSKTTKKTKKPTAVFSPVICDSLVGTRTKLYLRPERRSKVYFTLKNLIYDNEILYFLFNVKNRDKMDFDVEKITFAIGNSQAPKEGVSDEVKYLTDAYIPQKIASKSSIDFVVPLEKLSLSSSKCVIVNFAESEGERDFKYMIPYDIINNPFKIN